MDEGITDSKEFIEVRGDLNPQQRNVCEQLQSLIQELGGVKIRAIGMENNLVVVGGKKEPCVWFTIGNNPAERIIMTATNTFRKKTVAVVSNYSFRPQREKMEAIPFGATLEKYVLPKAKIILEDE